MAVFAMTSLEWARWQFGIVTVFHFIFVPLTIGMALFVAVCQTLHYRTGSDVYARMTAFWGKLMLISFAVGVVTGLVQEFQFGMNWSAYSRYVGDIFGAPLAMEGLVAFFVESTFIGLWIFGKGRLSAGVHLLTIWAVSLSTMASAFFILAANSWMQHPVGYEFNERAGRAELTDIFAVLTNSTLLFAFPHTILAAFTTAGMVVLGVSAYGLRRGKDAEAFRRSARIVLPAVCAAVLVTMTIGHFQGDLMEDQQPMKMAAAEALFETDTSVGMSVFATGDFTRNPGSTNRDIKIPYLLSLISTLNPHGEVHGINNIEREYQQRYGPGEYAPIVAVTYWTWRGMIGAGTAIFILTLIGLWLARRGKLETSRRYLGLMVFAAALPFIANTCGWVFTEMGRQPWVVQGLLLTNKGVSPTTSTAMVVTSLTVYTLLYGTLAAVAGWLFFRTAKAGPKATPVTDDRERADLTLAY
jgi:cytochrome bd ubiquinol oxidase subunit I